MLDLAPWLLGWLALTVLIVAGWSAWSKRRARAKRANLYPHW